MSFDDIYNTLRDAAYNVLKRQFYLDRSYDIDELANEAWLRGTRRLPDDSDLALVYWSAVMEMRRYVGGKRGSANRKRKEMHKKAVSLNLLYNKEDRSERFTYDDVDSVIYFINTLPESFQQNMIDRLQGKTLQEIADKNSVSKTWISRSFKKYAPEIKDIRIQRRIP